MRTRLNSKIVSGCKLRATHLLLVFSWIALMDPTPAFAQDSTDLNRQAIEFVSTYCISCHGEEAQEADRRFDELVGIGARKLDTVANREHWREVLDQLNLGAMPPEDADQPDDEQRLAMIELLTSELSKRHEGESADGFLMRRMTREEYDRSARKLLGLEEILADPTGSFSPDQRKDGFPNVSETMVVSDFLMKQYLAAADRYLDAAISIASADLNSANKKPERFTAPFYPEYNVGDGLNKDGEYQHLRESHSGHGYFLYIRKLLNRGGVAESGYYKIRIRATAINREHPYKDWIIDTGRQDPLVMSIVGTSTLQAKRRPLFTNSTDRTLAEFEVADDQPDWYEANVWIDQGHMIKFGYPNGPRRIKFMRHSLLKTHRDSFPEFISDHVNLFSTMHPDYNKEEAPALIEKFLAEQDALKKAGKQYQVYGVDHAMHTNEAWRTFYREYQGPRIRVFEIEMSGPTAKQMPVVLKPLVDKKLDDDGAKEYILKFAAQAARRPIGPNEKSKIAPILGLYDNARKKMDVNQATRLAYKAILCSPDFIYHRTRSGKLDQFDLANRLSFFLAGSPADDELLSLAAVGKLADRGILREQADRLLDADSSRQFVADFSKGWLKLYRLGTSLPDQDEHPTYFTERLESAMRDETELFLRDAFIKNRPVDWLIDSDQTFLNAPLARLYGDWNVEGLEMRQVKITNRLRGGLLGQASVLTASANGIDTSPVTRGVWVLECLLGIPPSPPPPDVEPLEPDIRGAVSIRDQLSKHRDVVACRQCHRRIDPLGFALETFDEIGRFRKEYGDWNEKKIPIDTAGQLPSGEKFADIGELRKLLVKQSALVERNLVAKLLVHATGRIDDASDSAEVLSMTSQNQTGSQMGMRDLLHAVILSDAFQR